MDTPETPKPAEQALEPALCCGIKHATQNKGKPIVLACQLCENSPTYWRKRIAG